MASVLFNVCSYIFERVSMLSNVLRRIEDLEEKLNDCLIFLEKKKQFSKCRKF